MEWTKEQREAIEYKGENILLAAAAGSGKTAVLVQRIIELIGGEGREGTPVDISELLVLTFTDAAASEMRGKIASAVNKSLDESPSDEHMQRQSLLLHSASISTIHSFCMNIIKANIHLTDLPVNFSLISDTENSIMLSQTLDGVLERYYSRIDQNPAFRKLVLGYGGIKNDEALRKTILSVLKFSKSMPYPAKWLNESVRAYRRTAEKGVLDDSWKACLEALFDEGKKEISDIYDLILREIDERLYPKHPYTEFFKTEATNVRNLFERLDEADYGEVRKGLSAFVFERQKSGVRGAEDELAAAQEAVKQYRSIAKNCMSELCELFKIEEAEMLERIKRTYPMVRTLKNIVLTVDRAYTRKKREKNYLDFNDLEHEALMLLTDSSGRPTEAALKIREKYREILVDEYQDTNGIQDTIFRAISRNNSNIFMVGDIKQSIYKFRNASPALFLNKYGTYEKENGGGHLIRLFKNFRSRSGVVNTVNYVFRCIMSREIGELDYTEDEYLVRGAEYPEVLENKLDTELHMICHDGELPDELEPVADKTELEARVAAKRIYEIVNGDFAVFDKQTGELRPAEYRDVVILMRNTKSTAPVFERVLSEWGIPAYTDVGRSYITSVEVQTVLSFLQITDNARQDIPLIAVMRSPIWGFTPDELAHMRTEMRKGCFYDAVTASAASGNKKTAEFVSVLEKFRKRTEHEGICKLIWSIYYELGYYAFAGSLSCGTERQANLRLLYERAAEFEHTKLTGLSGFMNYIETIRSEDDDLTPARLFGEGENVVRIMSIHKSKGLEFPIVILADTAHRFNMTDMSQNIIWHEKTGIAADYADTELRVRYPSLPRMLVSVRARRELMSEEMRLLYVALTRAREKLIITALFKESEKGWRRPVWDVEKKALAAYIRGSSCFRDWLCAAFLMHPQAKELREYCGLENRCMAEGAEFGLTTRIYENQLQIPCFEGEIGDSIYEKMTDADDEGLAEEIKARIDYEYPDKALGDIPVKLSVSEVKRIQSDDAEYVPVIEKLRYTGMAELEMKSGAERGTVVHFIMQMADTRNVNCEADITELVDRLKNERIITECMAKSVNTASIAAFFEGHFGQRMRNAERVEKEFSFYTEDTADAIYGNGLSQKVLLQGTIDCFFVEKDGTVVLIDFKTDNVKNRDAAIKKAENYRVQMKYYIKGLSEILERQVDECYLYFLECGEAVRVEA